MIYKLNRVQGYLIVIDSNDNVIAHLPIDNYPVKEGVDLLPPIEDDVEKLAKNFYWKRNSDKMLADSSRPNMIIGFIEGYNKAREKYKGEVETYRNMCFELLKILEK